MLNKIALLLLVSAFALAQEDAAPPADGRIFIAGGSGLIGPLTSV